MFELKLRSKLFSIPSNFRFFDDINPIIHKTLTEKNKYDVKSDVGEDVFQSFIRYLVYREPPIINKSNIHEYEKLSKEFDLMKDIIRLYRKTATCKLVWKNYELRKQLNQKNDLLHEKTSNYNHIIEILVNDEKIKSHQGVKTALLNSCLTENINNFDLLTQQNIILIEGLLYILNEQEKTAGLFIKLSPNYEDIKVPRSINYEDDEFIVKFIMDNAFKDSRSIKKVTFAENSELISIGKCAFSNSSLENITIPSSVTKICEEAFSSCQYLIEFEFQEDSKLTLISKKAFSNSSLQVISIPQNVEKIEDSAFYDCCQLRDAALNPNLKSIGKYSFCKTPIGRIYIPPKVKEIESYTFSNCRSLEIVTFDNDSDLEVIKKFAFLNSSISFLFLPQKLKKLEEGWACGTPYLNDIKAKGKTLENFLLYNKYIIGKHDLKSSNHSVLEFAKRNIITADIPSFVERIASFAFDECRDLETINFLEKSELKSIGKYAFSHTNVANIQIPTGVQELRKSFAISNNLNDISVLPTNCNFLYLDSSLLLGKSNENSNDYDVIILAKRSIKEASIPSFVKYIDPFAFYGCTMLQYVTFSNNAQLESIGKDAFAKCPIKKISIPPHVNKIGKFCFYGCRKLTSIEFNDSSDCLLIKNHAFEQTRIESFSVPLYVTEFGQDIFANCYHIKIVEIPENSQLSSIDISSFKRNTILMISPELRQSLIFDT